MPAQPFIIFPTSHSWHVATLHGDVPRVRDVRAGADMGSATASELRELGYAGQGVILALPTEWCFVASIQISDLPRHDRGAMIYRLEEKLPMPAEEFVADFAHDGDSALGVAARTAQIKPLVDVLENAGIAIQSIVPAALLAAIEPARPRAVSDEHQLLVFREEES